MGDILIQSMQRMPGLVGKLDEPATSGANAHSGNGMADGLRSPSTSGSTPDQDHDHDLDHDHDVDLDHDVKDPSQQEQQQPQPAKRKGGRKPIYATSEERKQRNRQAQAAFRERRTEYIKQLETTIKSHEENLASLQASQRSAADECLMLRYKNSLLERILVEKGIDVNAELHAKTGSPNQLPTRPTGPNGPAQNMTRFPMKFGTRRPLSISAKSDGTPTDGVVHQTRSPLSQATSASHLPSPIAPIARSPNFLPQGGNISPAFGPTAQPSQQLRPQQPLRQQFAQPARPAFAQNPMSSAQSSSSLSGSSGPRDPQAFFIAPFQNHYDQLEQEYDAQANMLEDDTEAPFPTAGYTAASMHAQIQQHQQHQQNNMPPPSPANPNVAHSAPQHADAVSGAQVPNLPPNYDPTMLDADPFGLSASMYFPTPYSFDGQR